MINKLLYILLIMMPLSVISQVFGQDVSARIMSGGYAIQGILVVNVHAERETRTDSMGIFRLQAKTGDTLIITDPGIKAIKVVVDDKFYNAVPVIHVEINEVHQLEEVVVEANHALTSEALGLVPEGQKRYTPQERKLRTAGDFKAYHLLGLLGGSFALDPVMNAINGRTKMLKTTVGIERKESAIEVLNRMFSEDEVVQDYNIPQDYVQGFFYYCVEDKQFVAAVKDDNAVKTKFLMSSLALEYLEAISEKP